jgi:hypothetical protein
MSFSYRWQRCNSGGVKCSNLKQGETVTGTSGTWSGAGPITFSYEWRRCDATGGDCRDTSSGQTRQLGTEDVSHTIRVEVRARNPYGATTATSAPTAVVPPKGPVPASTAPPVITGLAREGQTLTASVGSWANGPTSFAYTWRRCDANGNKCDGFATGPTVRLTPTDIGHRIRLVVAGTNQFGTSKATSAPTDRRGQGRRDAARRDQAALGETSLPVSMILPAAAVGDLGRAVPRPGSSAARRSRAASASPTPAGMSCAARSSTRSVCRTAGSGTRQRS